MSHAKLSPSSAARRVVCPGSRALEELYPQTLESVSAREGTAAHWLASEYLHGRYNVPEYAPNGELLTDEMFEGADLYEHRVKFGNPENIHIEERINIFDIHPECWGTPDAWYIDDNELVIFDYKFGHGYVEVFENWQLLEYACGLFTITENIEKITMVIIQPRSYTKEGPIRSWTIDKTKLFEYKSILEKTERKAMEPDALCIPSPACLHCKGRHVCSALQKTASNFIDVSISTESFELDSRQTASELKHLRHAALLIDARLTGLEEQAKSMILRGEYVPGFKLEPGAGREHWTKNTDEIIMLGELMGVNLAKPQEPITPAQARKIGIQDEILKQYSQRISGKLKLVEETNAHKVFKK